MAKNLQDWKWSNYVTTKRSLPASFVFRVEYRGTMLVRKVFIHRLPKFSRLRMEAVCPFKRLVSTYKSTRSYNPEDEHWHFNRSEILRSHMWVIMSLAKYLDPTTREHSDYKRISCREDALHQSAAVISIKMKADQHERKKTHRLYIRYRLEMRVIY